METSAVPTVASRAGRLVRAMELLQKGKVTSLGGTQYLVKGGDEDHYVDLSENQPCHCGDALWRSVDCKHITAIRLFRADPSLVKSIDDMLTAARAR